MEFIHCKLSHSDDADLTMQQIECFEGVSTHLARWFVIDTKHGATGAGRRRLHRLGRDQLVGRVRSQKSRQLGETFGAILVYRVHLPRHIMDVRLEQATTTKHQSAWNRGWEASQSGNQEIGDGRLSVWHVTAYIFQWQESKINQAYPRIVSHDVVILHREMFAVGQHQTWEKTVERIDVIYGSLYSALCLAALWHTFTHQPLAAGAPFPRLVNDIV